MTTGKRLGWDEDDSVTDIDILDPYDYDSDDLEGDLNIIQAKGPILKEHTIYLIGSEVADPKTIDPEELIRALQRHAEYRTIPFSETKRVVQWDPKPCPQCRANTDPNNVPVHPGCKCTILTDEIISPETQPSNDDLRDLIDALVNADIISPDAIRAGTELPVTLEINAQTLAAFDDSFRFSDFLKYVADHEDLLTNANQVLSVIIDENDQVTEQTEQGISTLVMVNDFIEKEGVSDTALTQGKSKAHNLVWRLRK